MGWKSFARTVVSGVLALALLVIFIGLPAVLAWVKYVGLGFGIPERLSEELSQGALEVKVGRVSFDVFLGFVAQEVHIFDKTTKSNMVRLSRLAVTPSLSQLLRGRILIERLSLAGAHAEVSVSALGRPAKMLRVGHLEGDAWLLEDHVRIPFLRGKVQGVRIEADALIETTAASQLASKPPAHPSLPSSQDDQEFLYRILEILEHVEFSQPEPVLHLLLRGSLERLAVPYFKLSCGPFRGERWKLESMEVEGSWDGKSGRLDQVEIRDSHGLLKLWGTFDNGLAEFEGNSNLDPSPWLKIFAPNLAREKWRFADAPKIEFRGRWKLHSSLDPLLVSGRFACRDLTFRGATIPSLRASFAWSPGKFLLRDAVIQSGQEEARGDFLSDEKGLRLRLSSRMQPGFLAPALDEKLRKTFDLFQFQEPPALQIVLQGPTWSDLQGEGQLALGRTAMRGVWLDSLRSRISVSQGAITYHDFLVKKNRAQATGTFTYDLRNQLVRLRDVVSELQPVEVLMWADPQIAESLKPYRFVQGPLVKASGVVYMQQPAKNELGIRVSARRGLDYDLLGKTLRFEQVHAQVRLEGQRLQVQILQTQVLGGKARVMADVSLDPTTPFWEAEINAQGVDFPSLTRLYFGYESSQGLASGQYKFRSRLGQELEMAGKGRVRVQDGNVFDIPLFGPLSEIISKILPGVGYETARLASADFEIAERRIRTRNLVIEGLGFSLHGEGTIGFPQGDMDMGIRINARGIPGVVFYPVSKLFEYVSDGTFSDPKWRPKIIPRVPLPTLPNTR